MDMKKFPWKGIGIGCAVLTMLVIARCAVTAGRVLYYGGTNWMSKVTADPWFYIGMAAAAACAACFLVLAQEESKKEQEDRP